MAYEEAIVIGLIGLMFWLVYFLRTLEDGKHDTVKFFLAAMAFIMGTQVITILIIIANTGANAQIAEILGTTYWMYGTLLATIVLYFIVQIGRFLLDAVLNKGKKKIQEPVRFGGGR